MLAGREKKNQERFLGPWEIGCAKQVGDPGNEIAK